MLGNRATEDDTDTDADIPRDEERRVGRTALGVGAEVEEHSLEGGEEVTVTEADNQGRAIESPGVMHTGKEQVATQSHRNANSGILMNQATAEGATARQARQNQANRKQHKEEARTLRDAQLLLAINSQVGREDTIRDGKADHADTGTPPLLQDKVVERYRGFILHLGARFQLQGRVNTKADEGDHQGNPKQHIVAMAHTINHECDRRADGRGDVVRKAVVADTLGTARGVQYINGHRTVRDGRSPEGCAMQRADNGKQEERPCHQIARKEGGEQKVAHQQHRASREGIDEIAAKGANQKGRERIARQHKANHLLIGREGIGQVKGQEGR